jgi:hypothetical protein
VCHVVTGVAKDTAGVGGQGGIPVPEDDCMGELPEWCCQCDEERGWHYESVLIHGEVVVDAVEEEVEGDADAIVWKVAVKC